jgi:hypothetical protein
MTPSVPHNQRLAERRKGEGLRPFSCKSEAPLQQLHQPECSGHDIHLYGTALSRQLRRLLSVPWDTRRCVFEHAADDSNSNNSISTRSVAPLQVPTLGQSSRQLREEHFQYYCYERDIIVDLAARFARSQTGRWLSQYGNVGVSNARHIVIKPFEEFLRGHSICTTVVIALEREAAPAAQGSFRPSGREEKEARKPEQSHAGQETAAQGPERNHREGRESALRRPFRSRPREVVSDCHQRDPGFTWPRISGSHLSLRAAAGRGRAERHCGSEARWPWRWMGDGPCRPRSGCRLLKHGLLSFQRQQESV